MAPAGNSRPHTPPPPGLPAAAARVHGYTEIKVIGRGSYGSATLVRSRKGQLCVVKSVNIGRLNVAQKDEAMNEVKVLSSLKHPYVVCYHESFIEGNTLAIVMDYAEGGDLQKRINRAKQAQQGFSEPQIISWFTQLALGLKYLHDRHVIHRDLKAQNLFLTKQDNLWIGDFGISKTIEDKVHYDAETIGTPYYLSPEILTHRLYSFASDVWALGCILYELAALRVPFDAQNLKGLVVKITHGTPQPLPPRFTAELRGLSTELLRRDHNERPSAAEVLQRGIVKTEIHRKFIEKTGGDAAAAPQQRPRSAVGPSTASGAVAAGRALERASGGGEALKPNTQLKDLNLHANLVREHSASSIAEGVAPCSSFRGLRGQDRGRPRSASTGSLLLRKSPVAASAPSTPSTSATASGTSADVHSNGSSRGSAVRMRSASSSGSRGGTQHCGTPAAVFRPRCGWRKCTGAPAVAPERSMANVQALLCRW